MNVINNIFYHCQSFISANVFEKVETFSSSLVVFVSPSFRRFGSVAMNGTFGACNFTLHYRSRIHQGAAADCELGSPNNAGFGEIR